MLQVAAWHGKREVSGAAWWCDSDGVGGLACCGGVGSVLACRSEALGDVACGVVW